MMIFHSIINSGTDLSRVPSFLGRCFVGTALVAAQVSQPTSVVAMHAFSIPIAASIEGDVYFWVSQYRWSWVIELVSKHLASHE
jgi:hypothetical protein